MENLKEPLRKALAPRFCSQLTYEDKAATAAVVNNNSRVFFFHFFFVCLDWRTVRFSSVRRWIDEKFASFVFCET